jgi:hypothetical protein
MARKVNPLTILGSLEKFLAAIPEGFAVSGVYSYDKGARLSLTASADAVRAAFPSARNNPGYSVGEVRVEGGAEIFDGERRLSLEVVGTETVPTVERVLSSTEDTDLHGLGVWAVEGNRRLWNLKAHAEVRAAVVVSDIPALRKLGVWVDSVPAADTVEATV